MAPSRPHLRKSWARVPAEPLVVIFSGFSRKTRNRERAKCGEHRQAARFLNPMRDRNSRHERDETREGTPEVARCPGYCPGGVGEDEKCKNGSLGLVRMSVKPRGGGTNIADTEIINNATEHRAKCKPPQIIIDYVPVRRVCLYEPPPPPHPVQNKRMNQRSRGVSK